MIGSLTVALITIVVGLKLTSRGTGGYTVPFLSVVPLALAAIAIIVSFIGLVYFVEWKIAPNWCVSYMDQ